MACAHSGVCPCATLRYQEDLEEVRSNIKSGKLSDLFFDNKQN
jgi:hypothetical protein